MFLPSFSGDGFGPSPWPDTSTSPMTVCLIFSKLLAQINFSHRHLPDSIDGINLVKANYYRIRLTDFIDARLTIQSKRVDRSQETSSSIEDRPSQEQVGNGLDRLSREVVEYYGLDDYLPDGVEFVLYPQMAVVLEVTTIEHGDVLVLQKRFKGSSDQKFFMTRDLETDDDLMLEEMRLYDERKRRDEFKKLDFFRRLKEINRLNIQYAAICNTIQL